MKEVNDDEKRKRAGKSYAERKEKAMITTKLGKSS